MHLLFLCSQNKRRSLTAEKLFDGQNGHQARSAGTENNARIEKHKSVVDTLLVHCYAGQSRSRAVGAFAVEMLGGDNRKYFEEGTPNQYIYDVLESAWVRKQLSRM